MASASFGVGWIEIFLFLLGGSGLLGMPPGDRDAAFLKAAPQNSLIYVEWAARGPGKVGAPGVDGLVADPEIQFLLKTIEAGLAPAGEPGADPDYEHSQFSSVDSLRLASLLTAHPGCIYATIDPAPAANGLLFVPNPQDLLKRLHVGVIIDAGADSDAIIDAFNVMSGKEVPHQPEMHAIPVPNGPQIVIHQEGTRLLVGVGANTITQIQAGLRGEVKGLDSSPRFQTGWKRIGLERVGSVTWFDVRGTTNIVLQSLGPAGAIAQPIIKGVGADALDYLLTGAGVVDGTVVQRSFLSTGGRTDGILLVAGSPPLKIEQLSHIPIDSDLVLAGSLSLGQVVQGVRELVGKTHPLSVQVFDETLKELEKELGLNLVNDVYPAFGNAWTAFSSPSEGGIAGSGLVAALEVRDPAKAQALYDRLLQLVEQALVPQGVEFGGEVELKQQEFLGHSISYVNGSGLSFGVNPSMIPTFCLTRGHLLFAVHPQAMKAHLRHLGQRRPGFDQVAMKKLSLTKDELLLGCYLDGVHSVQALSGLVPFMGQTIAEIVHTQGGTFDPFVIPSGAALIPYAGDITLSVARVNDGILMESRNPHLGIAMITGFVMINNWFHTGYEGYLEAQSKPAMDNGGLGVAEGQVVPAVAEKAAEPPKEKGGDAAARRAAPIIMKALIPDGVQQFIPDEVFRKLAEPPSPEALKQREKRRKELEAKKRERLERRRPKQPVP